MTRTRRPALRAELLEDRTTPAVTMTFAAGTGILTFEMSAATDSLTIGGSRNEGGDDVSFTDGVALFGEQENVTSIVVTDTSGGGGGQTLTFRDETFFGNEFLALAGSITVTGIESVVFNNPRGPTGVAGGMTLTDAVTVTQVSPTLPQISLNTTVGQNAPLRITASGTGDAIGSATLPLRVNPNGSLLSAVTTTGNGNQFYDLGGADNFATVERNSAGTVDAGTGTVTLTNGEIAGLSGSDFGDATTFALGANGFLNIANTEMIGGLTGSGEVGTSSAQDGNTLVVGGGNVSSTFDGRVVNVITGNTGTGALALTKTGAGTFTLTGANTYTGTTTVSGGTLVVGGAAGTLGTGPVTIQSGATLAFIRSDNLTVGNNISGGGFVAQLGTGTTTLTGANSYGDTLIDDGTLQVGAGGTAGTLGTGPVNFSGGTLAFNRSDALTVGNTISGVGILRQQGAGTTTLTGANTSFSGTTTVFAGTLVVNGSAGTGLTVVTGGTLGGNGILGELTATGGTVAPTPGATPLRAGNTDIGTGATFAPTVSFTVGTPGAALAVTGTVFLGGPLTVTRTGATAPTDGQQFTILDNDGTDAVLATFAGLGEGATVTDSLGSQYTISYAGGDGNDVVLTATGVTLAAATATTVTSSANPSVFGQPVTFTAVVANTSGGAVPTGTVRFFVDTQPVGNPVPLVNGVATFQTATLSVGGTGHVVEAFYTPTGTFLTSTGALTSNQEVNKAATTTTVTGPASSTLGEPVTFTATVAAVAPGAGTPTGMVQFFVNGNPQDAQVPLVNGRAMFATATLAVGVPVILAVYGGDANFGTSTSAAFQHTVTGVAASKAPIAVGGGPQGHVQGFDASGALTASFFTSANRFANARPAVADVNGDGTADFITVTGPGVPIRVTVFSGVNFSVLVQPFDPFGANFTGGGFVAAGDLDGDGKAEFVVTPDQGGGPRVSIFGLAGGAVQLRANFFGIDDPDFRGGVRPAVGDVNGDGTPDLAVAAGIDGGPRVAVFDGRTLLGTPAKLVNDFFAFPGEDATRLRNGSFVAIRDLNGDGFGEMIFGGGPGGAPRVFALSGALIVAGNVSGAYDAPVLNFFVNGNDQDRGGVRVAAKDVDGDARDDLVVGSGNGSPARVRVYLGKTIASAAEPDGAQELSVFGGGNLGDGVFVG